MIGDLQESVQDKTAFHSLGDYSTICNSFLVFVKDTAPTRIISPSHPHYDLHDEIVNSPAWVIVFEGNMHFWKGEG